MHEDKDRNILILPQSDSEKLERNMEDLRGVLRGFRDSVRLEADRPDFYWARQRNAIMERYHKPESPKHRRALLWVPAAVAVLMSLFFFAERREVPMPDLAAGYDQNLLIDVERALSTDHPHALAPALLITQEMEQSQTVQKHP